MSAQEAVEYGLIDSIIEHPTDLAVKASEFLCMQLGFDSVQSFISYDPRYPLPIVRVVENYTVMLISYLIQATVVEIGGLVTCNINI